MRFKSRLPVSPSQNPSEDNPEKNPPAETVDRVETREAGDPLSGAFDAISAVLRGEIDSLKRTIAELTTKVEQRIDAERASTKSAIDDLRQDVVSRVESLKEQTRTRANEIKSGLEQNLNAKEEKLVKELEGVTRTLSGVRSDLERQMTTSGQVTALLSNMAHIFAAGKVAPNEPAQPASRSASPSD